MSSKFFTLFEVIGVEIEYMVAEMNQLEINPIVDFLLQSLAGKITNELSFDKVAISNELVSHVIELKMAQPQKLTAQTHVDFHQLLTTKILPLLAKQNSILVPTSMHPFLKPDDPQIKIWPHGNHEIYHKYDEIFGCHGHGFSNIQSIHLNLPFANNEEFIQLHQAIRVILPLIPALCASSPYVEGKQTQALDNRLLFYKNNQKKIPIISGEMIPEEVISIEDYYHKILDPIDKALVPYNSNKILEPEWVNSRGAIARFERNAIEIRLMDAQECPLADFACVAAITAILKDLIYDYPVNIPLKITTLELKNILMQSLNHGLQGSIDNKKFLQALSVDCHKHYNFNQLIEKLIERCDHYIEPCYLTALETILRKGALAERMIKFLNVANASPQDLQSLMRALSNSLVENKMLLA